MCVCEDVSVCVGVCVRGRVSVCVCVCVPTKARPEGTEVAKNSPTLVRAQSVRSQQGRVSTWAELDLGLPRGHGHFPWHGGASGLY